jgi:hypothetical protein
LRPLHVLSAFGASFSILAQLPMLADSVASFRAFNLTDSVAQQFAEQALALRHDHPDMAPIRAEQLLGVRRGEGAGDSLWALTNRVQQNWLRGGMCGTPAE